MQAWISKLINEYQIGNATQAVLVTKADPKQRWFQPLWEFPICFSNGKVIFNRPGLPPEGMMFGTAFVYLGPNIDAFDATFRAFGHVVLPRQS